MTNWYYVRGRERVGPISQQELEELVANGDLMAESYVWRKGFENWRKLGTVDELKSLLEKDNKVENIPQISNEPREINWENLPEDRRMFSIKIGLDRGGEEKEYGPFNLKELQRAYEEHRINEKTLVFVPGMPNWQFLGDLPIYESKFSSAPPEIEEKDRRQAVRKPFVARLFFHDENQFFEGICRDVSTGGMQVLVSEFPGEVGEEISMNVHPDNSDYSFVATGKIVRHLDGDQGFSLRFVELSDEAKKAIHQYIENN